tara:strand:+ start:203 stop:439 length:237 start_codon:yes stop_codon:yes gene_type:complete
MKVGDLVKCALFEKKGVITETYDLSTPSSRMEIVKLSWEDGKEETVNVTTHPQRLKKMTEAEVQKDQDDSFGKDLSEP